jgi:hypothetical protein
MFNKISLKVVQFIRKCGTAGEVTGDNIVWPMGFACWRTEATDIHSEYVIQITLPWHHSSERTCLIITFIRAMPGLLFVRRQTFLNVRVVSSHLVLRTYWGSIVYFQVKFHDTFRHSMQAPGGKIRQNKAWTFIDYLVLTWHETPECGRRLNGLVTLHWSVEISFIVWW